MTSTNYNKLIIQVSLQKFSFCVKNQLSNEILHYNSFLINQLASLENQLESIFNKNELLQVSYSDVLVLHDNNLNTFVPETFFDERILGSYLQYNTKVFATDFFIYDELEFHKMKNVYVPYVAYNNFFIDQFGAFTYKHINSNLVEYVLNASKDIDDNLVYCNVSNDHFEIVVCNKNKLILFNSFEIQTPEDFIYYVLFTYEQLKLNPEQTPVYLFGAIKKGDVNYQIIFNYIKNVYLINSDLIGKMENIDTNHNNFILIHS